MASNKDARPLLCPLVELDGKRTNQAVAPGLRDPVDKPNNEDMWMSMSAYGLMPVAVVWSPVDKPGHADYCWTMHERIQGHITWCLEEREDNE